MLTSWAAHDDNAETEKKQLSDLEGQLLEARRQLAVLKQNAQARAKTPKKCPRELVSARTTMSSQMDAKSPAELLRKAARCQTRRRQAVRLVRMTPRSVVICSVPFHCNPSCEQGLDGVSSTDRDADQMTTNTDGLLLAVDKFLSTAESHHPLISNSGAVR
ncbi:unnamed protein product [Calypogeia fissa]